MTSIEKSGLKLAIQLGGRRSSPTSSSAVAEVIRIDDPSSSLIDPVRIRLGVNDVEEVSVVPGDYTVRVFLPNGNVVAESISVSTENCRVDFDLPSIRSDAFAEESLVGVLGRLPNADRADALERYGSSLQSEPEPAGSAPSAIVPRRGGAHLAGASIREELSSRLRQAAADVRLNRSSIEKIGGKESLARFHASAWTLSAGEGSEDRYLGLTASQRAAYAKRDLEALRAWIGGAAADSVPFTVQTMAEVDAKLAVPEVAFDERFLNGELRSFATAIDGMGDAHIAVFPRAWRRFTGERATSSLLVALGIDTVLRDQADPSERARWRCSPVVDDPDFNSYMGFLSRGMTEAAEVMLRQATGYLFEKTQNPIAAAAGALGLLMHSSRDPSEHLPWRRWIENLYRRAPNLPDGAVAMARMYWRYGDANADRGGELDVEVLRGFALEAV